LRFAITPSERSNGLRHLIRRSSQSIGKQNARILHDGGQFRAPFLQRRRGQILSVEVQEIEGIEKDGVIGMRRAMLEAELGDDVFGDTSPSTTPSLR
jgi:hypothetical protein